MKKLLLLTILAIPALAGDEAPSWLREVATAKAPAYAPKVPAVVLLDEETVGVDDNGHVITTDRKAIRILTREGNAEAVAHKIYVVKTGKVRDLHAWMIRPSGEVKKYSKNDEADVSLAFNEMYNEARARLISGKADADPGAVFGYETVSEDRSIFTQFEWGFQDRLPVLLSRFSLNLPAGWRAEGVVFNGKAAPQVSGSSYSWEYRDLPFIEEEPSSPAISALAPRLAVSYFPAESAKAIMGKTFSGWPDLARWAAQLEEPQEVADAELSAKAHSLAAGAASEWERIRAIGNYVQSLHYVAIEIGLGRGGGYQPHPANEVFHKQYGDCKDKANLMLTMLKSVGIASYMVSASATDPTYVHREWPSPQQFNHAVVAVKLSDAGIQTPAAILHPKFGRLLFFDPTDESTPLGDLPQSEQGGLVLIDAPDGGELVRMPVIPADANRVERETDIQLASDGAITAHVREHAFGQSGAGYRHDLHSEAAGDFAKRIERWISRGATGAAIGKVDPADSPVADRFDLQVDFQAARYAQLMQGRLLMFRPAVVPHYGVPVFRSATRQNPVMLHAQAFEETVHVTLPAGFQVDELPDSGKLDTPFGVYTCSYKAQGGTLTYNRKLVIPAATVPVEKYAELKAFFEHVGGAEQQPVVLVRE